MAERNCAECIWYRSVTGRRIVSGSELGKLPLKVFIYRLFIGRLGDCVFLKSHKCHYAVCGSSGFFSMSPIAVRVYRHDMLLAVHSVYLFSLLMVAGIVQYSAAVCWHDWPLRCKDEARPNLRNLLEVTHIFAIKISGAASEVQGWRWRGFPCTRNHVFGNITPFRVTDVCRRFERS